MAKTIKKTIRDSVSRILLSNRVEAASTLPNSKHISVFDGYKTTYIPKTEANIRQLNKKFGKPRKNDYRGKNRITWLDHNIF